ncbi:DUF2924 domain-containing protein [Stieleria sp. ICT_E10.1]|uniref:DUF2924 domain-containing protein n=1 Tax=Stieleria sedimenti TaxID=2976331 RepID=UPI0021801C73|nr:DUF2924 domain-containing protein [Stieleria sedimenti]MCS7465184.1 DUF2924 domain-containing protein [Stieleria sedimenti]
MSPETKLKVAKLSDLTIGQLAAKYEKLFGEKCRSRNRRYVHRRIAWKLQADDEGGLSEQAILRATVVAGESLIRLTPLKSRKSKKKEESKVPEIFDFYLKLRSLLPVVEKLEELGWANKTWLTRKGRHKGGRPFDKCSVHSLLTNVLYVGRIRHKENVYDDVHEPIIQPDVFDAVQKMLKEHGQGSGKRLINRQNALLKGMLYCPTCGYAMAHSPTKKKSKLYRHYVCQTAIKRGHAQCRTESIPARPRQRTEKDDRLICQAERNVQLRNPRRHDERLGCRWMSAQALRIAAQALQ